MTRFVLAAAALGLASASLFASPARAQSESLVVCIEDFEGRAPEDFDCAVTGVPVGIEECEANPLLQLDVRNVPSSSSTLDFWREDGTSCAPTVERDGMDDTCIHLSYTEEAMSPETPLTANLRDFLECAPDQAEVTREIYVFAGSSSPERGDVPFGVLKIAVDTKRPPAPTNVESGTGENAIPVEWDSAGTNLYRHNVYVIREGESFTGTSADAGVATDAGTPTDAGGTTDAGPVPPGDAGTAADAGASDASIPDGAVGIAGDGSIDDGSVTLIDSGGGGVDAGGGSSGDCDTSGITPGVVPEGMEPTKTVSGDQRRTTIDAIALGLVPGDRAAVVVTAVDQARNESPISAPACLTVVETVSFCERVGCGDDGCSCVAAGADTKDAPWAALTFGAALLGATLWRRRRRG